MDVEYICPFTKERCINYEDTKENPFTGTRYLEMCAFGTKDGACSVARLISAMTVYFKDGRY